MKGIVFALGLLFLSSCSSLKNQVFKEIHKGQTEEEVVKKLGIPDSFQSLDTVANYKGWLYEKRADKCVISFLDQKVVDTTCQEDPNYVNPVRRVIGSILKGGGEGVIRGSQNRLNCQSHDYGGNIQTTCY